MKKVALFVLLLICFCSFARAQSCPEKFKAYNNGVEVTQFCVGEPIEFRSCVPGTQPDKEYYDFDKDDANGVDFPNLNKIHTYTQPGTYTVTQLINDGNPPPAVLPNRTFTVLAKPRPTFTATVCGLNQVLLRITDSAYDYYLVNFGDGVERKVSARKDTIYQYTGSSPFKITLIGKYKNATCSNTNDINITPLPVANTPLLENIKLDASGTTGNLTFSRAQPEYIYIIERQTASGFTLVDSVKNPTNATVPYQLKNIPAASSSCYRVRVTDKCSSILSASNTVCTLPLTTTAVNNSIELNWPPYPLLFVSYEIFRDGQPFRRVFRTTNKFEDIEVVCGQKYCYQVVAIISQQSSSIESTSNESCQTAVSTQIPAPGYISSTFTPDNKITLLFKAPDTETTKEITFQKTVNNTTSNLAVSTQLTATDNSNGTASCYTATYQNNCNQISTLSNTTCLIFLEANLAANNEAVLKWSEYIGFANGVEQYFLERLDGSGNVQDSKPVTGTSFSDPIPVGEQVLIYRIKVVAKSSGEISFSNTVRLNQESRLLVPTAFTPNGDNLNDRFEVKGAYIKELRMIIYNRWGQVVFHSNSQQKGWDGRINGKEAPIGVYSYSITGRAEDGKGLTKTGTITLLR